MAKYVEGSVYFYAPNKVAPVIFAVLFALSGAVHFYQTYRYRSWRTTLLMPWAALILTVGFAVREYGAYHYDNIDILIANSVLIMSGPPVYALINYIVLSRILYYIPYLSPLHPGRVLTTFLAADGLTEILVVNGVQRVVNKRLNDKEREVGEALVKSALILQTVLFLSFFLLGGIFHARAAKAGVLTPKIRTVLRVMYASCTIITARCVYRVVEYFQGYTGTLFTHEAYFYVFEAAIMLVNTLLLNVWHPGQRLPRDNKVFLAPDGTTEREGPGWKDSRPFFATLFDPFDVWGIFTRRDKKTRFWEMEPDELAAFCAEEKRRTMEKRNQPRTWWMKVLDPANLFGYHGRIPTAIRRKNEQRDAKELAKSQGEVNAEGTGSTAAEDE